MYTLGIETSCDETAISVVKDGRAVLSSIVASSIKFHKKYGGVIPEIASRKHLEVIDFCLNEALKESNLKLKDIDLIAVTSGPGLKGSLLVGICFAKAISYGSDIPLMEVDHLYSHLYAAFLQPERYDIPPKAKNHRRAKKDSDSQTRLPFVGLVISGGHTSLFYVKDFTDIKTLGFTLDDACGEAFDKVAKLLRLGYPGGPLIERLARKGDPKKIKFGPIRTKRPLDFSFSGIKTAVLYYIRDAGYKIKDTQTHSGYPLTFIRDIAASFQEAVIDTLVEKAILACRMQHINSLVIGGGVAANHRLRERFSQLAESHKIKVYFSAVEFCTDNAAMVAGLGYLLFKKTKSRV